MSRPLRILSNDYFSSVPGSGAVAHGGPANFANFLSKHAIADGHHWIGIVHAYRDLGHGEHRVLVNQKNRTIIGVGVSTAAINSLVLKKDNRRPDLVAAETISFLADVIKEQKPDVFFLNGFSVFAWMLFEAARSAGVPIVIQHAGIWAREVRQYAENFSPQGRRACYWMERRTAQYADANVFLNETSRDVFSSALRVTKIFGSEIIPLPHPGWKFVPKARRHTDVLVIGCVARWDRIKNHEGYLAFAQAAKALGVPWKFLSVTNVPNGNPNTKFKQEYKKAITVIPQMSREELKGFYDMTDVMVVASHFETGPFIVMEAASRGVPTVVSPHVGWVSEYRRHGMEKWIINFNHPYAAVRKLRDLMSRTSSPETTKFAKWLEMGHSPTTVYQSYLRLFRRCSSSRRV